MQGCFDPRLWVGAHFFGTNGHDVAERISQVVLIAIGREDRLFGRCGVVSDVTGVVRDQNLRRQALAVDQGLGDHQVHAGLNIGIGED